MKFRLSLLSTSPARLIAALSLSTLLVACGGGSSGGDLDGDFTDVPVIGDGDIIDSADLVDFDEVISVDGCQGGTDTSSSTPDWDDNCQVLVGGDHATSSYAQGIQRIIFSRGFTAGVADIITFSDGIFGPNTEDQVMAFQEAQGIQVDGIVGPETWAELQATLELLGSTEFDDVFGVVSDGPQSGQSQFFQSVLEATAGSWTIAVTPGLGNVAPFDIGPPL